MKKITLQFYILIIGSISTIGCSSYYFEKAGTHYNNMAYSKAIKYYEKVAGKEKYMLAKKMLAESNRLMNNYEKQEYWYKQISNSPLMNDVDNLYFAQSLMNNGKYVEAKGPLLKYLEKFPEDFAAHKLRFTLDFIQVYFKDSAEYSVKLLDINSPSASSFGATFYKDGVVFSSEIPRGIRSKKCEWTGRPYLDLYFSKILPDEMYSKPVDLAGINWKYHEGPCTFNQQGTEIYFTSGLLDRDDKPVKNKEGTNALGIYKASKTNEGWTNVQQVPLTNNELFSFGHPALSPDNKLLFFVSDMEGGMGGTDIYVSQWENDHWGNPKNLGPIVNTPGKEMFPFMASDGKLYYSSNGMGGLGGMDIFSCSKENDQWEKPANLGFPFNSFGDDISFVIRDQSGFFSSNRESISGIDYLYSFRKMAPKFFVNGIVVNTESKLPVKSIEVELLDQGQSIFKTSTDSSGSFSFPLQKDKEYSIKVRNNAYSAHSGLSTIDKKVSETFFVQMELPDPVFSLKGMVVDDETHLPLAGVKLQLNNLSQGNSVKEIVTDENGDFSFELGQEEAYSLTGSKDNFLTAIRNTATIGKTRSEQLFVELPLAKLVINKPIRVDNILYDYKKWDIREDAKPELNKLVELMSINPAIQIELSSHCDSRGSDQLNMNLSQKRAESAVAYIVSNGIGQNRIKAKGYGETKLLNNCFNSVDCSEADHQYNRRTEFQITGINQPQLTESVK